ncbi:MAG: histidine kinase [Eggerthellaceae bacterium]|nr:histidine kinase [Eggerthellaceae bacterium]
MERPLDKIIVCLGSLVALAFVDVSTYEVVGLLASIIAAALFELTTGRHRRVGLAAFCVLAVVRPRTALFLPLVVYDCLRTHDASRSHDGTHDAPHDRDGALVCVLAAVALIAALPRLPLGAAAVLACVSATAAMLSRRTTHVLEREKEQTSARDTLREHSLALEAKNRDLRDRQDYEVHVATLTERGRIAREIHDNVGHLLTRAVLQTEALRVAHAEDPALARELEPLAATLSEALSSVRTSVHALHDDAFDLEEQLRACAARCAPLDVQLDYAADDVPTPVALCFIAVTREALANTLRHSNATAAHVRVVEYPALYQLTVTDNGSTRARCDEASSDANEAEGVGARSVGAASDGRGMGLHSMEERVTALGGTFRAEHVAERGGWRVFVALPKEEERAA